MALKLTYYSQREPKNIGSNKAPKHNELAISLARHYTDSWVHRQRNAFKRRFNERSKDET
jgi:hypothetical protein